MKKATFVLSLITILALLVPAAGAQSTFTKTVTPFAPALGDTVTVSFQVAVDSASINNTFTIVDPIPANMQVVEPLPAGFTTDSVNVTWTGMVDAASYPSFDVSYQLQVASYVTTEVNSTARLSVEGYGEVDADDAPFYIAWTQTLPVPASSGVPFPDAGGTNPFVTITTGDSQDLGSVTASYVNTFLPTTTGVQTQTAAIYFQVNPTTVGPFDPAVQLVFSIPTEALHGVACADVRVYSNHGTGNEWTNLGGTGVEVGGACQVTVGVSEFSYFVMGTEANAPTAITLETFASSGSAPLALLAVAVVALTVLGLALRRRSA